MLEPITDHQKEIKEINKNLLFLRDNFDMNHQDAFFEELLNIVKKLREEIDYHFNLQIYGITNEKAKPFVNENRLVRDMLFRMIDFIKAKAIEKSLDAFMKIDDIDEIIRAYLQKEEGLFIQQLKSVLSDEEIEEVEENIKKLI